VSAKVAFTSGAAYSAANWNVSSSYATPEQALRVSPSSLDQVVGMFGLQKILSRKWFQKEVVFGNNTGLSAHPRQPFQSNQVVDGSTFVAGEYAGDVVGMGNVVAFKGGFLNEVGFGTANPHDLVGGNDYIITGATAGDLAGILSFYAKPTEAHIKAPDAALGTVSAQNFQVTIEDGAHADNAYGAFVHPPTTINGGTIDKGYNVYLRKPTSGSPSSYWSLYAEGKVETAGELKAIGLVPVDQATARGAYLGISTNVNASLSLSSGAVNLRLANNEAGAFSFEHAGTAVLATLNTDGVFSARGHGAFATSNEISAASRVPPSSTIAKGVYIGRDALANPGVSIGNGTMVYRMSSENDKLTFSRPGLSVLLEVNSSGDLLTKGVVSITDGKDVAIGGTLGTKFGASTSKLGLWGATPVARPTGTPSAATDLASTQALVNFLRNALINEGLVA
jgi:acetyltransferase-like isoleucine patch superfamily enzyme